MEHTISIVGVTDDPRTDEAEALTSLKVLLAAHVAFAAHTIEICRWFINSLPNPLFHPACWHRLSCDSCDLRPTESSVKTPEAWPFHDEAAWCWRCCWLPLGLRHVTHFMMHAWVQANRVGLYYVCDCRVGVMSKDVLWCTVKRSVDGFQNWEMALGEHRFERALVILVVVLAFDRPDRNWW